MYCTNCGAENSEDRRYCRECGSALPAQPVGHGGGPPPRTGPLKLRVNMFCLAGAILAVLSLFLPWTVEVNEYTMADDREYKGAFDYDEGEYGVQTYPDTFRFSVTIFLIGTILAFITPFGGIIQFIGSMGFILTSSTTQFEGIDTTWWIGSGIALVASIIVIISLAVPVGVGYDDDSEDGYGLARLLAWTVYR